MPDPVNTSAAWFEHIYANAGMDHAAVPWDRQTAHPQLTGWLSLSGSASVQNSALVVGCGLGDDAQAVAAADYLTTAFDVSPSAIEGARRRFPQSDVDFQVADLLALPAKWKGAFDLVVEIWTVQAMPMHLRHQAIAAIATLVAPGGTLLVVANARLDHQVTPNGPPWPLSKEDLDLFTREGLEEVSRDFQQFDSRTWTAVFRAPDA